MQKQKPNNPQITQMDKEMSFRTLRFCHSERSEESRCFAKGRLREESDPEGHSERSEESHRVPSLPDWVKWKENYLYYSIY